MYNAPEMQTRTLRYPALTRIREAIPSTEPPAEIGAAIVRAVRGNGPPERDSRVPPLGLVPNRLGSRPGTGCGEAILIAFTQVSQPEEGAYRSRRERSSLPDIGSNRSASWAPAGVERDPSNAPSAFAPPTACRSRGRPDLVIECPGLPAPSWAVTLTAPSRG